MLPGGSPHDQHDLAHVSWVDLYYADPAQHLMTAGEELDDLDHDLSDPSDLDHDLSDLSDL